MGLLKIHHKTSKRKLENSLPNETYQKDASSLDKESTRVTSFDTLIDVDEALANGSAPSRKPLQRQFKSPRKRGSSFALVKRQASETYTPTYTPTFTTSTPTFYTYLPLTTEIATPSSSSSSPAPTNTQTQQNQAPLSSLAVQLILGILAAICFICVFIRCVRVGRKHDAAVAAQRQRNLSDATAMAALHASVLRGGRGETTRAHLVPTNEMTLAGRLNLYQARAGVTVSTYPYGQEPLGAAAGGENGIPLDSSVNSFVAPSYECDVSPPPFMTNAGKPPSYFEVVNPPVRAPTPSNPPSDPPRET
ncbi:hypothetical protein BGX26_012365 [Mortierella sp. AD094]|nr:hypothetical protein BGX26_012365 [Mortierella sp. AD094]